MESLLFFFFFSSFVHFTGIEISLAANTVSPEIFIHGGKPLNFSFLGHELGFFLPANSNSRYLGMLCKNSPKTPDRVVWVAIRDNPSFDKLIVGLLANNSLPELCLTTFSLDCKNGDTFLKLAGITLSKSKVSIYESVSYLNKCEADWSNNCSCRAYSSFKVSGGTTGCLMWFLDLNEVGKDHEYDVMPGTYFLVQSATLLISDIRGEIIKWMLSRLITKKIKFLMFYLSISQLQVSSSSS